MDWRELVLHMLPGGFGNASKFLRQIRSFAPDRSTYLHLGAKRDTDPMRHRKAMLIEYSSRKPTWQSLL